MCIHLDFDYRKATQALNFFAEKEGGIINKMKAIKLVYFADRYHLRKYGRPISNDEYVAMKFGPVNSGVKDIAEFSDFAGEEEREYASAFIKKEGSHYFKSIQVSNRKVFSESDIEALEFAWKTFGGLDQFELAELTHNYPEWKKHEEKLKPHSLRTRVRMDYEDFLGDPENGSNPCFSLNEEEKQDRRERLRELSHIEQLWN